MTAKQPFHRWTDAASIVCATGAGVIALAGLASWCLGRWRLLTFGEGLVPMAPSTALLMLALCTATILRLCWPSHRAARAIENGLCLFALCGAGFFGLQFLLGFQLPVESWLAGTSETVGDIPVGRMSPLTAGSFGVAALASLGGRVSTGFLGPWRTFAGALALAVLTLSGIIVAGYWVGSPFLYGGATIPMALLTAVAFVLLSAAITLAAGSDAWPLRMFVRRAGSGQRERRHQVEWPLLMLSLVLTAGIILVGIQYLDGRQVAAREAAHQQLEAIVDLKVQQIVSWRKERLADAHLIRSTPYAVRLALEALAQPESSRTRAMFTGFLEPLLENGAYEQVLLLDAGLNVRLVHPEDTSRTLAEPARRAAEQALLTGEMVIADIHRAADSDHIHLGYSVPLVVRREGTDDNVPAADVPPSPTDRSAGVLLLQLDVQDFLFPLIQRWPTPSRTAETLLVRREGEAVVFLNELRHRQGTALNLRHPLTEARLPAAMVLRGEAGIIQGIDYRGERVVAAARPVPDSPWVILAKVDQAELYAPLRQEALRVGAMVLALLSAVVLGVTVLWRRGNERLLRAQLAAEHERRITAERFQLLMKSSNDAILLADEKGRILEFNDRALALYGYPEAEFRGLTLLSLRPAELQADFARREAELAANGQMLFETRHRRKDGLVFPVEISSRLVEIGGSRWNLGILRDITQRKAHEAEIERLNRLYATLSQVNQTIVRCESRARLFDDICRIGIDFGKFRAAWIGWQGADGTLGTASSRVANDGLEMPGRSLGCGVVAEAMRTGQACLCNDAQSDALAVCCRETMTRVGVQSCAAFPLRLRGQVTGVFSICAIEPGFFNAEEIRLLEEVTADITFAVDRLDKDEQRAQAEAALRRRDADLQLTLEAGRMGDWNWNIITGEVVWSDRCKALYGLPADTVMNYERFLGAVHPDDRERVDASLRVALESRGPYDLEKRIVWPDGSVRWTASRGRVFLDATNQAERMTGVSWDITERKQAELKLEEHLRELQRWHDAILGREGRVLELKQQVNELLMKAGQPIRYSSAAEVGAAGSLPAASGGFQPPEPSGDS